MCLRAVAESSHRFADLGDQLDLQLKSTTRAATSDTDIVYDLDVRAYDLLRKDRLRCPRLLVLLVLPVDEADWLTQTVEGLILRRCAYWMSLRGAAPTPARSTIRINIPRSNVFSVEALQAIMNALTQGERP